MKSPNTHGAPFRLRRGDGVVIEQPDGVELARMTYNGWVGLPRSQSGNVLIVMPHGVRARIVHREETP